MSKQTQIMGVINATPNSYFADSRCTSVESATERGLQMESQGAAILDIGGECTSHSRYKQEFKKENQVSHEEEARRVVPIIQSLRDKTSCQLSVDTRRAPVARAALEAGAHIINDISGFRDPAMTELVAEFGCRCVIMHMQGDPETMQMDPSYPEGIVPTVLSYLERQAQTLTQAGVKEEHIILDPGICFGKTLEDNYTLLGAIPLIKKLGFPVLIGVSRKSLIQRILEKETEKLLTATTALHALLVALGVDILRVHDVNEAQDIITLLTHPAVAGLYAERG